MPHHILTDLGASFHQNTLDQAEAEQEFAVKAAEEAIWAQAEVIKADALTKALEKAHKEHEKVIRKLHKAHEKAIKVGI